MGGFSEKILKNSEVCETLKVSDYKRKQLIAAGILDEPVDTGGSYRQHTLSQVERARARLLDLARPKPRGNSARRTKPLSNKMIHSLRNLPATY